MSSVMAFMLISVDVFFLSAGHFHHRVHVVRKPQTVFEEDKEESQDHE